LTTTNKTIRTNASPFIAMKVTHSPYKRRKSTQRRHNLCPVTVNPSPAESLADISGREAKTTKAGRRDSTRQNRTSQTITPTTPTTTTPFLFPRRANLSAADKAILAVVRNDLATFPTARDRSSETILLNTIVDEAEVDEDGSSMGCLLLNEKPSLTRSADDSIAISLGTKDSVDHWRKSSMCIRSLPCELLDSLGHGDFDEEAEPRPNEGPTIAEEASRRLISTFARELTGALQLATERRS
jgi:hypothetical protein